MKRSLSFVVLSVAAAGLVWAQMNPRGNAAMEGGKVKVDYGRPSAKGRDVLSMVTPGSYWRMGADQSTTLVTEVPLVVGGSEVAKGAYTLLGHFASADEFYLVVARSVGEDGDPTDVAAKVKGEITRGQEHVEQLTLGFEGGAESAALVLSWAGSRIRMPLKVGS